MLYEVITLSGDQLVDHIHCRSEKRFDAVLGGSIGNGLCQETFSHARIADEDDVHFTADKFKIQQPKNGCFVLSYNFV